MRQARDLLYRKVHLGSNPNPGASPARSSSGAFHQMFHSLVAGQSRLVGMKASFAPSSICLAAMLPPIAAAPLTITSTPTSRMHGIGDWDYSNSIRRTFPGRGWSRRSSRRTASLTGVSGEQDCKKLLSSWFRIS